MGALSVTPFLPPWMKWRSRSLPSPLIRTMAPLPSLTPGSPPTSLTKYESVPGSYTTASASPTWSTVARRFGAGVCAISGAARARHAAAGVISLMVLRSLRSAMTGPPSRRLDLACGEGGPRRGGGRWFWSPLDGWTGALHLSPPVSSDTGLTAVMVQLTDLIPATTDQGASTGP